MKKDWTEGAAGRYARSNLPFDHNLLDQAKRTCPHSDKAMMDEYDRLLEAKLNRRPRGFWSRIFGE